VRYDREMRSFTLFGLLAANLITACTSCGPSGPAVPFGLGEPDESSETTPEPEESPTGEHQGQARTFPAGTTRVDIEGAPLEDPGSIRALLARDLDADGDRDVVALVAGPPRVLFWRRNGSAFEAPQTLGSAPAAEGCEIDRADVSPLGDRWLVVRSALVCPEAPADQRIDHWVIDTDRTPRPLEHFATLGPQTAGAPDVDLELASDDRDEDGRDDLTVTVRVGDSDAPGIVLSWLDRPSGLARDATEPEASLVERSRDALRRLRRSPRQAMLRSQRVLDLHRVVCRESTHARLLVGGTAGLPCGRSDGAGRAATTIVRARAASGQALEALEALEALANPGLDINEERRTFARRALEDLPPTPGLRLREGPVLTASGASAVTLTALGFLDEDRVLLRGPTPSVWDIATDGTQPAEDGARAVRDASGRLEVVAIERTCDGRVLRISTNGLPSTSPLLHPLEPPAGADCPLTGPIARESGGWRLLGWAPQGVLAARGAELRVVPLDVSGRAAGASRTLSPSAPTPAPLPAGAISRDGRFLAQLRGPGVLLHDRRHDGEPELLWPEGWGSLDGEPTDAAASPSGQRVAVLRAGRVYLLDRQDEAAASP